jgi:hypothetical protein
VRTPGVNLFDCRRGDTPRSVKVTLDGYKTVEQLVVPDGKIIPISLTLESK